MVKPSRLWDVLIAVAGLGTAGLVYHQTYTAFGPEATGIGGPLSNSAFYPRLVSGVLVFCSVVIILRTLFFRKQKKEQDEEPVPMPSETSQEVSQRSVYVQCVVVACLLLLYTLGLPPLGYRLASPIFMIIFFLILGVKKISHLILLTFFSVFGLYFFFAQLLDIILPVGWIFSN